jgi:predicted RNA-binding Zn ribbon-like protein
MESFSHPETEAPATGVPTGAQLLIAFVNTVDLETPGVDELRSPDLCADWLRQHGLLDAGEPVTAADVVRVIEVREALRNLILGNTGEPVDPAAATVLERHSRSAPLRVSVAAGGSVGLAPVRPGVDAALGRLLATVAAATMDGSWRRLKACRKHSCRFAFYDRSKNGSRSWCDMSSCGNRVKAARYRERAAARS